PPGPDGQLRSWFFPPPPVWSVPHFEASPQLGSNRAAACPHLPLRGQQAGLPGVLPYVLPRPVFARLREHARERGPVAFCCTRRARQKSEEVTRENVVT